MLALELYMIHTSHTVCVNWSGLYIKKESVITLAFYLLGVHNITYRVQSHLYCYQECSFPSNLS